MYIGLDFIDWQNNLHYFLHVIFPFVVSWIFFRKNWIRAGLIMALTLIVDLDHLLANPAFDPERCSINFHPLHSYWAIGVYFTGIIYKKTRWIATGLVLHMITDLIDCIWTFKSCHECLQNSSIYEPIEFFI